MELSEPKILNQGTLKDQHLKIKISFPFIFVLLMSWSWKFREMEEKPLWVEGSVPMAKGWNIRIFKDFSNPNHSTILKIINNCCVCFKYHPSPFFHAWKSRDWVLLASPATGIGLTGSNPMKLENLSSFYLFIYLLFVYLFISILFI